VIAILCTAADRHLAGELFTWQRMAILWDMKNKKHAEWELMYVNVDVYRSGEKMVKCVVTYILYHIIRFQKRNTILFGCGHR
jgi:hypothetical protein